MTTTLPQQRRSWRGLMWLAVALAAMGLVALLRTPRGGTGADLLPGLGLFAGGLVLAGWVGIRGARQTARDRAAEGRNAAQVMLVAELGRHDDATLERITRSSGPAADAARMILQGRHLGNPSGNLRHPPMES